MKKRRQREAAEKMREEAVRSRNNMLGQNKQYEDVIRRWRRPCLLRKLKTGRH